MPNAESLLRKKATLMKAFPLILTTLFFFMIAPIEQLEPIRNVDPVLAFSGALLLFVGIVFLIEGFRNLPDAGNHAGAKTGAGVFFVMGALTFVYGIASLTGAYNPFDSAGASDIPNIGLTILLGVSSILLYLGVHSEVVLRKKSTAHAIRTAYR